MSRTRYKQPGKTPLSTARSTQVSARAARYTGSYNARSIALRSPKPPVPKKNTTFKSVTAASRRLAAAEKTAPSFGNVQNLVTVYIVEPNGTTTEFKVYKDFLVYSSQFFNAAFNGNFTEADTQTMKLHDTNAKSFGLLVSYIYIGELENGGIITADDLLNLWMLADRVLMPKLQNHVLRIVESLTEFEPSKSVLQMIYHPDRQYSILRDFLTEFFALNQCAALANPEDLPKEMLAEIFVIARDMLVKKGGKFTHQRLCKFLVEEESHSRF